MKKLLTAVCATLALMLSPAWAQMAEDPSVLLAKIQADKKGVVEKSLNLTPAEAKKFWPLYEKFQRELDVPHREYALAVRDYIGAGEVDDRRERHAPDRARCWRRTSPSRRCARSTSRKCRRSCPASRRRGTSRSRTRSRPIQRYETAKAIPLAY